MANKKKFKGKRSSTKPIAPKMDQVVSPSEESLSGVLNERRLVGIDKTIPKSNIILPKCGMIRGGTIVLGSNKNSIPGISSFLSQSEIDELHRGKYVSSGDFEKAMELSKQDPFFFAVRGEPGGTVIANSKGSVLLPGCRIKLGTKVDYRY